jgi:hypothetical protein
MMYILTNGVFAKGIAFLRLPGAAIYTILTRISGTKRQKKRCWSQQYMSYGPDVTDHTITILLLLVFGVVQPFVPMMALFYFIANFFYARYDLLYTFREAFQSGGLFWPVVRAIFTLHLNARYVSLRRSRSPGTLSKRGSLIQG